MNATPGGAGLLDRVGSPVQPDQAPRNDTDEPKMAHAPIRFGRMSRWLANRRASRLVTTLALFTVGPLIALSAITISSSYSTLSAAARSRLADVNTLVGMTVATEVLTQGMTVESSLVGRPEFIAGFGDGNHRTFDKAALNSTLKDLRALLPTSHVVFVTDASGKYWGDGIPADTAGAAGQDFSSADWYQGVTRENGPYVSSGFHHGEPGSQIMFAIATPVVSNGTNAPTGERLGMLVTYVPMGDADVLWGDELSGHEPVYLEVTDQYGFVISSSYGKVTDLVRDDSEGVAEALDGESTVRRLDIDGQDSFAAYGPIPIINWTVRSSVPASQALADANQLLVQVLVISLILLALMLLTKIILYLMIRDLQAARGDLAASNATLEQRVAERTRELEESNRELEAFSFSVSHDLRAPLRSIDGFSRLVIEESGDALPDRSMRMLDKVRSNAQQMGVLIDELLGFSRLSHVEMHRQYVEPSPIVVEIVAELRRDNPDRNIDFVVGDLPPCHADPGRVAQVYRNLLSNAVKFTAPRPTARIEVGALPGGDPDHPGMAVYYVTDNGVGFDMRYAGKLFEPFERLHPADEFTGTGVGLALVRRVVERHGGRVWAEGAEDAGASFFFTLEAEDVRSATH